MSKVLELKIQLNNVIFEALKEYDFKQTFKALFIEELKNTINLRREELFQGENYRIIRNSIKINIYKNLKSHDFEETLNSFIDNNLKALEESNRTIENILTHSVINGIKVYIYNHKDDLTGTIKSFLNSDDIDKKIQEQINSVINGINPMASRFVNPSTIFSKLKLSINDYLNDSKNIMYIINMINAQLDTFTKKKISEFTSYFPAESRKALVNSISKAIMDRMLSEYYIDLAIDKGEEVLLTTLNSIKENENNNINKFDNILSRFLDDFYDKLLGNNKSKKLIEQLSGSIVDELLNKPIISFIDA